MSTDGMVIAGRLRWVSMWLAFILAVQVGTLCYTVFHKDRWEYRILSEPDEKMAFQLDSAGFSGWEIVSTPRRVQGPGREAQYEVVLKRRK